MNKLVIYFGLALALISCASKQDKMDPFFLRIMDLPTTQKVISLGSITDFIWDDVVLCNPCVTQEELDALPLGLKKNEVDLKRIIAFRKSGRIVKMLVYDYDPNTPYPVEFIIQSNHFVVVNKKDASFAIMRFDNHIELRMR